MSNGKFCTVYFGLCVYIGIPKDHPWANRDWYLDEEYYRHHCPVGVTYASSSLPERIPAEGLDQNNYFFIGWFYDRADYYQEVGKKDARRVLEKSIKYYSQYLLTSSLTLSYMDACK